MWWKCPAWQNVRSKHGIAAGAYSAAWPRCLSICGLMPEGFEVQAWPGMMPEIVDLTDDSKSAEVVDLTDESAWTAE
eukprot:1694887-Karenia_brevis.AAC.1